MKLKIFIWIKICWIYDVKNNKIIGKITDETHVVLVGDFVGLKSKMYSYIKKVNEEDKNANETEAWRT